MVKKLHIKEVEGDDFKLISNLITNIFNKHIGPTYSRKGKEEFYKVISPSYLQNKSNDGDLIRRVVLGNETVGTVHLKRNHIVLLFVHNNHHGKGIGKFIIQWVTDKVRKITKENFVTVNSAPTSVDFYKNFGFVAQSSLQEKNGIKYIPMILEI